VADCGPRRSSSGKTTPLHAGDWCERLQTGAVTSSGRLGVTGGLLIPFPDCLSNRKAAMKRQEIADLIFEMLSRVLAGTDFRLKKGEEGFVRKIPGGRQMLGVPLWDYNPEFEFSLNICIRLDAAEEVFHRFSGSAPKYHSMSFTTMTRLESFTGGPPRYKVTTAGDVASVGDLLSSVVREKIIPFLNENNNILCLNRTVNYERPEIDATQNPSRSMHSVILAHLARSEDFDRLVAKHRTDMQLAPGVSHAFNRLVESLGTH
jgi:hypothetical protein